MSALSTTNADGPVALSARSRSGLAGWSQVRRLAPRSSVLSTLGFTAAIFGFLSLRTESFLTEFNQFNVTRTASLALLIALSQMSVMVIGDMNIAVGGIGAMTVVMVGTAFEDLGWSPVPAVALALLVAVGAGLFNGALILLAKVNSFVITLGTLFVFQGLKTAISRGFPYTEIPDGFTELGRGDVAGVPNIFYLSLAILLAMGAMFRYLRIGRHLLAYGGNRLAAERLGVNAAKMTLIAHAVSGLLAGIAAVLWVSRTGAAQPNTGDDWILISFSVAIIGGTALTGGVVTMLGMFAGAFMLAYIRNGLILLDANVYWEQVFLGSVILAAVAVPRLRDVVETKWKQLHGRKQ